LHTFDCMHATAVDGHSENATLYSPVELMYLLLERMTSLPVSVLVLGIGIVRSQSIGYWVLGAELGIVLTLVLLLDCP